ADRENLADLEKARDLVAKAIKENPDAHFGREKYQLKFIEWLLTNPTYLVDDAAESASQRSGWIPNVLGVGNSDRARTAVGDNDNVKEMGLGDALAGISGLITMGAAWES